ncbi:hypothetical protein BH20ACT2_BH20ACT2_03250 [soil metagenome]
MAGVVGLEELFVREYPRLVRALAVAGDAAHAADAIQEAFIAADRRWAHVSRLDDPAGWVRRVAVNRLSNQRRDPRRRTEILGGLRPPDPAELEPVDLDLLAALESLTDRQRLALCLHHLPRGGNHGASATFTPYAGQQDYPSRTGPPVKVEVPVTVVDDPARSDREPADALAAMAADPRLASWLSSTSSIVDRPDLDQSYRLELSWGSHHCLGASLARLEGEIAIGTLIRRFPGLNLAGEPAWNGRINLRGLERLELTVG